MGHTRVIDSKSIEQIYKELDIKQGSGHWPVVLCVYDGLLSVEEAKQVLRDLEIRQFLEA